MLVCGTVLARLREGDWEDRRVTSGGGVGWRHSCLYGGGVISSSGRARIVVAGVNGILFLFAIFFGTVLVRLGEEVWEDVGMSPGGGARVARGGAGGRGGGGCGGLMPGIGGFKKLGPTIFGGEKESLEEGEKARRRGGTRCWGGGRGRVSLLTRLMKWERGGGVGGGADDLDNEVNRD